MEKIKINKRLDMQASRCDSPRMTQTTIQDYEKLKSALLDLGRDHYENARSELIGRIGYDQFRDLQNLVFKEIGTLKFKETFQG